MRSRNPAALAPVALAVGALLLGAGAAQAQNKQVYFLSWGGTIQTMLEKEGWADQFAKDTGYTVTLVPKATSGEIIATAVAQKDKPQVDVVMCDLIAFLQGTDQGIFAKIDPAKVANMAKMAEMAKLPDGTGVYTYADILSIIYHEGMFKKKGWAPPTTWADLLRPEFKGAVIIPPVNNTYGLYTLVEFARMNGGSEDNIDPGFAALKKAAPNVVDWTTTFAKIGTLMESETAAIAVFGNASGWEIKGKGIPVNVVIPKPAYVSPTVAGIMKGSPNPAGADALLNWLIGEKVLTYRAERFGNTPMNKDVKVSDQAKERVLIGDQLNNLAKLDYAKALAHRADWNARFEREVATIK
ncbi:MAG: extracellular solute-binding protein [Alphaproteobacteria bacterium]|nr:extracellular solute-binding protein [Alphaproteobacteria bacterium]